MPTFSKRSQERLATCHPDLQRLFNEVIKEIDCAVLCGHRGKADQDAAVKGGFSKTVFPNSKHNSLPSMAVDVAPWPLDWNNKQSFVELANVVLTKAKELGIEVRWGGHFRSFFDGPHFELVVKK